MRGRTSLLFLLVLLCASNGWTWTHTTSSPTSPDTKVYNCTQREGTSLTILIEECRTYFDSTYLYYFEPVLNDISARFPCVTKQYTSILLNNTETKELITTDKNTFLQSFMGDDWLSKCNNFDLYKQMENCNQSLLYGLKRALQISPAESIIAIVTSGSMADYNDTQLLSEVYTLLEEKKSQVHFVWHFGFCAVNDDQKDILNKLSFLSFGEFISVPNKQHFKFIQSMKLLMSKPLNSSVQILHANASVTGNYTEAFNVRKSLTFLLIARDETFALQLTDPKGNTVKFEKIPSDYYKRQKFLDSINYHLVKSPAAGTWTLNAQGEGSLTVRILGFSGLNISGNCSDSECHPNATCGEFGGDQQCTCKEGFAGDGSSCEDMYECHDQYGNNCKRYGAMCVNTIGSYTCECNNGFEYKEGIGCIDINECADSSLNDCPPPAICVNYYGYYFCKCKSGFEHKEGIGCVKMNKCADSSLNECHPLAICTSYYQSYTCTCPYGYYGDGRHCEVNECQQGTPCTSNEECIKYVGSYSCNDPCSNHTVLEDHWRSTSNVRIDRDFYDNWAHCDSALNGWYQLTGEFGQQMPEYCVPEYSCGTHLPMWLSGKHPTIEDGIVNRTACANWNENCCLWSITILVKNCAKGYYVYKLQQTPTCPMAYCVESFDSCSLMGCAPDEECKIVDGVLGCHLKN